MANDLKLTYRFAIIVRFENTNLVVELHQVGGFNPYETSACQIRSFPPNRDEHRKIFGTQIYTNLKIHLSHILCLVAVFQMSNKSMKGARRSVLPLRDLKDPRPWFRVNAPENPGGVLVLKMTPGLAVKPAKPKLVGGFNLLLKKNAQVKMGFIFPQCSGWKIKRTVWKLATT